MTKKVSKSRWGGVTDSHDILDGLAKVYRVKMSGEVWQFRMYIRDEKKDYRKSLKTRDLTTALERGRALGSKLLGDVSVGKKVFGLTLSELVDAYCEERERDVRAGNIVAGRLVTIKSQLKHLLEIKGDKLKTSELDRNSIFDWKLLRQEQKDRVSPTTIRNEMATLNHLCSWAYRKGMIEFERFNFETLRIRPDDFSSRDTFTLDEYERLFTFMRSFTAKSRVEDETERRERMIARDYVLISANTLMRVGELRQLTWNDVRRIEEPTKDDTGKSVTPVHILVRGETSKVRKTREIITRGGNYFRRLEETYGGVKGEELVFRYLDRNEKLGHRFWAKYWKLLMNGAKITDYKERKVTWYSLRHFGISMRVNSGNNILDVAKMAGTSVSHVEKTYLKYDQKRMRKAILKGYVTEDGGFEDLE